MTPTPRTLYIHDDLITLTATRPQTEHLARRLLELAGRHAHVRVLTLAAQLDAVAAQGPYGPFAVTIGIAGAGEAVARALHARTGWFPSIHRIEVAREETSGDVYQLVTNGAGSLVEQLAPVTRATSIALVDDTVFSGLTLGAVLRALPADAQARTRAFCLRAVDVSLGPLRGICPVTVGFSAPGRLLDDVSFINASGLVRRGAIRRAGQPPLAFYERPEWIRAWFPDAADEVIACCAALAQQLDDVSGPGTPSRRRPDDSAAAPASRTGRPSSSGTRASCREGP